MPTSSNLSSNDIAVSVRDLSKVYTIAHNGEKHTTAGEAIMHRLKNPMVKPETENFWALKDINFDIQKGDVVGIVGRNGAGKSTLLKILSRITEPTTGQIDLFGRVGSLLEVGTGFHPELTGRENVFLNGAILGMAKSEITRQFDAIVDFSGTEKFLDTPVKRYSSGMYVRLAFAVAAHLNPEILIIDEVLAVGDAEFQKKCIGKMQDVADSGRTVIFVSHNMATVRQLCNTGIMLKAGTVDRVGDAAEIVSCYNEEGKQQQFASRISKAGIELVDVEIIDAHKGFATRSPVFNNDYEILLKMHAHNPIPDVCLEVHIIDDMGALVSRLCSLEEGLSPVSLKGNHSFAFKLPRLQLFPGKYSMSVYLTKMLNPSKPLEAESALIFEVEPAVVNDAAWAYRKDHGVVRLCDGIESFGEQERSYLSSQKLGV